MICKLFERFFSQAYRILPGRDTFEQKSDNFNLFQISDRRWQCLSAETYMRLHVNVRSWLLYMTKMGLCCIHPLNRCYNFHACMHAFICKHSNEWTRCVYHLVGFQFHLFCFVFLCHSSEPHCVTIISFPLLSINEIVKDMNSVYMHLKLMWVKWKSKIREFFFFCCVV